MKRSLILLLILIAVALASGVASAVTVARSVYTVAPGLTMRGYLLSADDSAYYHIYFPQGMTLRPRITVHPASTLRLAARLEAYPTDLIDDSCDDAVIEFAALNLDGAAGDLSVWPCPGQLDIDTPYVIDFDYDMPLQEIEPNNTYDTAMFVDQRQPMFADYTGTIEPADDIDRYRFFDGDAGQHLQVTMTSAGGVQPWLTLLGPNTAVDSTPCGASTASACLDVTLPEYGDYQIYARSAGGSGDYTLSVDFGVNMAGEPNDHFEDWANLALGGPHFAAIDPVGDVDFYNFGGRYGDILRVTLNFGPEFALPRVRVTLDGPYWPKDITDVLSADNPSLDIVMPYVNPGDVFKLRFTDEDNGAGDPEAIYYWATIEWVGPYVSSDLDGLGGRFARKQGDLLVREFDDKGAYWSLVFDASDVGITQDVTAAEFLPNGTLLLALGSAQTVPGLGKVMPQDIIRFVPAPYGLGEGTAGVFEWYLDGSDVGLTTSGEKIDAIALSTTDPEEFALVISLSGGGSVPKAGGGSLAVADEDQIRLANAVFGADSGGVWAMHQDGSTAVNQDGSLAKLGAEDVSGLTLLRVPSTVDARGDALIILRDAFSMRGVDGNARDVLWARQGWAPNQMMVKWLAANNYADKRMDAISVGPAIED